MTTFTPSSERNIASYPESLLGNEAKRNSVGLQNLSCKNNRVFDCTYINSSLEHCILQYTVTGGLNTVYTVVKHIAAI